MIIKVTGYPVSYAVREKRGWVNKKLKINTLAAEETRLYIWWEVAMEVSSTPRIYTMIMFASVKPKR